MKLSARSMLKEKSSRSGKGRRPPTSSITNEAVDELKLAAGQTAYAVIKASDVMVAID